MSFRRHSVRALTGLVVSTMLAVAMLAVPIGTAPASAVTGSGSSTGAGGHQKAERLCSGKVEPGHMQCYAIRRTPEEGRLGPSAEPDIRGYVPADLAAAYDLPRDAGEGMTVAVVDAYDDPTAESDLAIYRQQFDLPPCTTANGCFSKIDQRGGTDYPRPDASWAGEISLDLDAVSAVCPRCHILLVEADSNSAEDLGIAVDRAVAAGAQVVSNSYGGPESQEMIDSVEQHYRHPGVAITAASGDNGYRVSYPASSPYVTGVGGTSLNRDDTTARGWTEQVWRNYAGAPGSGCSALEDKPFFQHDTGCDNRTVADVSAVADPITGVAVYQSYGAPYPGWWQMGGTSLSAPVIAGVYALAGEPLADDSPNWYPYAAAGGLHDVTSGNNGDCEPAYLCTAGPGYDGPTGLGTPDGVAAFAPPGPHGHLAGTVTDARTGDPLPQATVTVSGNGTELTTTTDAHGRYDVTAKPGDYDTTVTAFGHVKGSTSAHVTDGQTTTADVALTPEPLVTLSGTVRDGSGHGWPMYARISAPGTPLPPVHSDPVTGRYSMQVPAHSTFTLHVTAAHLRGYLPTDQEVTVDQGDVSRPLSLQVNEETCAAPGYAHRFEGMPAEGFDKDEVPAGWTVSNETENGGWEFDKQSLFPRHNQTAGSGNFALIDTQRQPRKVSTLTTPPVDLTGVQHPVVGFRNYYVGAVPVQSADVGVSVDGGDTWTTLWERNGPDVDSGPLALPIPQAAGKSGVLVRFHYAAQDGRYWELDDVYVGTRTCAPMAGGLVSGRVIDANTGDGIDGATVASADQPERRTTSVATPEDDTVGDGYYAIFAPGSGSTRFTASSRNRVSKTQAVQVAADARTQADFRLAAGQLTITPRPVSTDVRLGKSGSTTVTVTNSGTSTANVHLVEQPGGFEMLDRRVARDSMPVRRVDAAVSTGRRIAPGARPATAERADSGVAASGSGESDWQPLADYPGGPIMDDAVARGPDGRIYVVGGTADGYGPTGKAYVYDPTRLLWQPISDLPIPVQEPAAGFVGGKLVVAGGWSVNDAITDVQVYDPATDSWSAGAPLPEPRAAAGSAVLAGRLYVVGGCIVGDCEPGTTDVSVYDPVRDRWTSAADYPDAETFLACGGIDRTVVCAGGLDATSSDGSAATYAYSPRSDTWQRRADLPTALWGSASAAANGQLLMSGGVAGSPAAESAVTNQGFRYDPQADAWHPLPNAPAPFYRGAAACGVYRIGGAADHFNATAVATSLPGLDLCGASGDVPWLTESRTAFTLRPGESTTVTLWTDAGDSSVVSQPGDYAAQIAVRADVPVQAKPVTVTMHVQPPKRWGKLTGTVGAIDCDGTTTPLAGATVSVQSRGSSTTLWTDDDGGWSLWVDSRGSGATVAFSKDRYTTVVKHVRPRAHRSVTVDATLHRARC